MKNFEKARKILKKRKIFEKNDENFDPKNRRFSTNFRVVKKWPKMTKNDQKWPKIDLF